MRTVLVSSVVLGLLCAMVTACSKRKESASADEGGAQGGTQGGSVSDPATGATLAFLNGFEGEIDAVIKEGGEAPKPLAVLVKSGKLRFDVPETASQKSNLGAKAYVVVDSAAKKASMVSEAQRQVLVLDLNRGGEQLKGFMQGFKGMETPHAPGAAPQKAPPRVTKTGKFDTVAGYKCENWDVTTTYRESTVCVAQEGASWFSLPTTGLPTEHAWMAELFDGKHFPLRFISYAEDGTTEKSRGEVTKIDKKGPAASAFEIPAGYRVIDLAQMLQGFAGGMPSGMPMMPRPARGKGP